MDKNVVSFLKKKSTLVYALLDVLENIQLRFVTLPRCGLFSYNGAPPSIVLFT